MRETRRRFPSYYYSLLIILALLLLSQCFPMFSAHDDQTVSKSQALAASSSSVQQAKQVSILDNLQVQIKRRGRRFIPRPAGRSNSAAFGNNQASLCSQVIVALFSVFSISFLLFLV
ncbi:hypothetical protein M9H77_06836 [Catharanthus roseus]|uniref:Uncharacterized protein n=1 Tax=Catharanthus roseus TaxID=4058 RepID=A0ACC0BT84_CATRO|nr:hypothetical protein M9H77_06836 [Catharanthus roseus]